MDIITITGIAAALAMDALSISVINGMMIKELKIRHAIMIAFSFGFFQGLMPLIGWFAGLAFRSYIDSYAHFIAAALLFFMGGKMLWESLHVAEGKTCKTCLEPDTLIIMSIATSLDALATGISFSILNLDIIEPVIIISSVTFVLCFTGIIAANRFASLCERHLERIGGTVLIMIGIKIILEHYL